MGLPHDSEQEGAHQQLGSRTERGRERDTANPSQADQGLEPANSARHLVVGTTAKGGARALQHANSKKSIVQIDRERRKKGRERQEKEVPGV